MTGIMMSALGNWKPAAASSGPTLVYDLDAANYAAVPTTASTVAGTGAYAITVANAGGGGFNQLRMWSRSAATEVQTADIGFVKVYDGVLTLAEMQAQYATYATRFGY